MLFGGVESEESFQKSIKGMAREDANLRWQKFMASYFEKLEGWPDQSMVQLEHVFNTE